MNIVLTISAIVLAIGALLLVFSDHYDGFGGFLVIVALVIGFGFIAVAAPVKHQEIRAQAHIYCSTDVGECRVITAKHEFTIKGYPEVDLLASNGWDSVTIRIWYNSYGREIDSELVMPAPKH